MLIFCLLQPCYLKDWEMHVQFKIHGSGKKNLHGDGLAVWYTKERLHPGKFESCDPVKDNSDPVWSSFSDHFHCALHDFKCNELYCGLYVCVVHLWSICKPALSSLQLIVSYFHLGPVFGNQDHFIGLAIFVDTFRNDLQGMDVSVPYSWVLLSLQAPCLEVVPISMGWPFL